MRILSVTAQKPHSTGSGIYLTELVKGFAEMGHEQAVVAGIYQDDAICFPEGVSFHPVYYNVSNLPFPIAGMSDQMPYDSTRYSEMTDLMIQQFKHVFAAELKAAVNSFCPDIILCHHLYLLTALIRETFTDANIIGICHGTDIRQMKKNCLEHQYIVDQIKNLNLILALHEDQKLDIVKTYGADNNKIEVIGSGYNRAVFHDWERVPGPDHVTVIYAGKLAQKKGVMNLISCLGNLVDIKPSMFTLKLAGGYGNQADYEEICGLMKQCKYPVELLGKLTQTELAEEFRRSDIFILPSFYEGLPLVILEALASGLKVVATDLPGVRPWMDKNIPHNNISYVRPPVMVNTDEPDRDTLPQFEADLAQALKEAIGTLVEIPIDASISADIEAVEKEKADLSNVSWQGVCNKILLQWGEHIGNINN